MFEAPLNLFYIFPLFILWSIPFFIKKKGIKFSSLSVSKINPGWRSRFSYIPQLFLLGTMVLLVVALAQPVKPPESKELKQEGIAIELVVDNSSSMEERIVDGVRFIRKLDAVKQAVFDFTMGNQKNLDGRSSDLIGLITFAKYANTLYPLTFNRNPLAGVIENIDTAQRKVDGTHFGAGLQMAIARLDALNLKEEKNIKSRIIIFLTDGQNRINDIDPIEMAKLARSKNIKIYTIAFATQQQELLQMIAEITNGKSYEARNSGTLERVYNDIDSLEKSELGDIEEAKGDPDSFKYLISGILLYFSYIFLRFTIFRRFP